ncbi:MAG: thiamine pyrophosphate-dependent dehydrogenase E1 component subunit alpha [Myxococcales bacterium]|nr:thiamine pyrophosphate-dependent dehydrogenase E1 component subunit alpha [Myxococcales bacterium]
MDALRVFDIMAKARALEERLRKISKTEHGYFWVGGTGEEAFNVPLGLLVQKGQGPAFDYLHLHYRSGAILTAMGMPMIDAVRQMCSRATDRFSGGRNFVHHYSIPAWNVVPVSSTIETQYTMAPGTALAQKRFGGTGITIVNGGDAGTSEGDFATCLNWSSIPGRELPVLILVVNNQWGISTPFSEIRGEQTAIQRCGSYGIRWETVDGNDPTASWNALSAAIAYVRDTRKPFGLEAAVSRLHGHSSSSGGARVDEPDCFEAFKGQLIEQGTASEDQLETIYIGHEDEARKAFETVVREPLPTPDTIYDHIFAEENSWQP